MCTVQYSNAIYIYIYICGWTPEEGREGTEKKMPPPVKKERDRETWLRCRPRETGLSGGDGLRGNVAYILYVFCVRTLLPSSSNGPTTEPRLWRSSVRFPGTHYYVCATRIFPERRAHVCDVCSTRAVSDERWLRFSERKTARENAIPGLLSYFWTFSRRSDFISHRIGRSKRWIFHRVRWTDPFDMLKHSKCRRGWNVRKARRAPEKRRGRAVAGEKCCEENPRYSMKLPLYFYDALKYTVVLYAHSKCYS